MTHIFEVPFHIGDFLSGTIHMDAEQIGAYMMLIIAHYNAGEQGIPNDDRQLATIAKVSPRIWKKIRPILEPKFTVNANFWEHKKCVEVIQKVKEKSLAARTKALKRYNPPPAVAPPQHCNGSAHDLPSTKPLTTKPIRKEKNILKKETQGSEKFLQFWNVYPRHRRGNRENAWRSWQRALVEERATEDEILRGAKSYTASGPGEFAKGAAAWLNDDRWTWQTTDTAVRMDEEKQDWPPWKIDFAQLIGDKNTFSWFKDSDFRDGVLIVKNKFHEQKVREMFSEKLQKLGLKEIRAA